MLWSIHELSYSTNVLQKMEYANEQDHLKVGSHVLLSEFLSQVASTLSRLLQLQNFFNDLLTNKKLLSTMADPSIMSAMEVVKKKSMYFKKESYYAVLYCNDDYKPLIRSLRKKSNAKPCPNLSCFFGSFLGMVVVDGSSLIRFNIEGI